jgi:hypothetical protein
MIDELKVNIVSSFDERNRGNQITSDILNL